MATYNDLIQLIQAQREQAEVRQPDTLDKINRILETISSGVTTYQTKQKARAEAQKLAEETRRLQSANRPTSEVIPSDVYEKAKQAGFPQRMAEFDPPIERAMANLTKTKEGLQTSGIEEAPTESFMQGEIQRRPDFTGKSFLQGGVPVRTRATPYTRQELADIYKTSTGGQLPDLTMEQNIALGRSQVTPEDIFKAIQAENRATIMAGGISQRQEQTQSFQQAQQQRSQEFQASQRGALLPQKEVDDLASTKSALELNKSVRAQYFSLLKSNNSPVDPVTGRWTELNQKFGTMDSATKATFMADVAAQFIAYLNKMSGAAITADEAERLKKRIATVAATPSQFLGTMDSVEEEVSRNIRNKVLVLKAGGYNMDKFNKILPPELTVSLDELLADESVPPKIRQEAIDARDFGIAETKIIRAFLKDMRGVRK